jgi:protein TonB
MEPNKILSANILDLLFDDRNKEYGAYELRKSYSRRITKALVITGTVTLLVFTGVALANSIKPAGNGNLIVDSVVLSDIPPDVKPLEPLPKPKEIPPPQARTVQVTNLVIVDDKDVPKPPATQDDMQLAKIDIKTQDGVPGIGLADTKEIDNNTGIIEAKDTKDEGPVGFVEIDAKFTGNWEKFLIRNLDPQVPANNNAPEGRYTVVVQFVVDLEGNVSDIKPMTGLGYGMEQEAIRVIKKATKWEPAIQNGRHVKAYRKQPITFVVEGQ